MRVTRTSRRARFASMLIASLAALVSAPARDATATSTAAGPVLPPSLQNQLMRAYTGGKSVCSATPAHDGTAVYFSLALPASSSGPDASGLYRRDLTTGVATRLLPTPNEQNCGQFASNGSLFASRSGAGDLVVLDLVNRTRHQLCSSCAAVGPLRFSDDGRYLFSSLTDGRLIRYDHQTGLQQAVPDATGAPLSAWANDYSISGDGQRVAFASGSSGVVSQPATQPNSVYAYVSNFASGRTQLISWEASTPVFGDRPLISADGTHVTYLRFGPSGVGHVALVALQSGEQQLLSVTPGSAPGNGSSVPMAISANGDAVLFESVATDLVAGVTVQLPNAPPLLSEHSPLYYRDVRSAETVLVTRSTNDDRNATDGGGDATFDRAGDTVVFISHADDLVAGGPPNNLDHAYSFSMLTRSATLLSHDWPTPAPAFSPRISDRGGVIVFDLGGDFFGVPSLPYVAGFATTEGPAPAPLPTPGQTPGQVQSGGQTPGQTRSAGQTPGQVQSAGQSAGQVQSAGQSAGQVQSAGQSAGQVQSAGPTPGQIQSAVSSPPLAAAATEIGSPTTSASGSFTAGASGSSVLESAAPAMGSQTNSAQSGTLPVTGSSSGVTVVIGLLLLPLCGWVAWRLARKVNARPPRP